MHLASGQPVPASTATVSTREPWVDNLRCFLVMLVVNMHACCTYSHVGSWYVTEGPEPALSQKIPYLYWQGHLQSFFMGLLFFISGHYVFRSLSRRGTASFLKERLLRLGVPTLIFIFLIHPFIVVGLNPYGIPADKIQPWLWKYFTEFGWPARTGPLWFALALLVFSAAFALWTLVRPSALTPREKEAPGLRRLAWFAVVLVCGTFLVRIWQPIGANILNMQLCFFVQYVAAFHAGVLSARQGWWSKLASSRLAARLGGWALPGGPVLLTLCLVWFPPAGDPPAFAGGWNPAAFLLAFWEQVTGLALGLGCLALFSRRFNRETGFSRWLCDNTFGVYLLHTPVLVAFTQLYAPLQLGVTPKVLLLTASGLVATFLLSGLLRLIPGMKKIF